MQANKLLSLVFVFDGRSVLLGLKKRGFGQGKYNGFGGKLEAGEVMRACAARELREEAGLSVPAAALVRRGVLNFHMLADSGMKGADGTIASRLEVHIYSCSLGDAEGEVAESEEMAPRWWGCDQVPLGQMWADDAHWLPHVLAGGDVIGDFTFADQATLLSHSLDKLPPGAMQLDEQRIRRLRVDHLVYGVPGSLEEACAAFEAATGVAPTKGGAHKGLGTHNALVALGGAEDGSCGASCGYLELLALDPAQQPRPERVWMAMESIAARGEARLVTWAHTPARGLEACAAAAAAAGYQPGDVQSFSRQTPDGRTLQWQLAYRHYTEAMLPSDGLVPFLIEWAPPCAAFTPAASAPRGIELLSLRAESAAPLEASASLAALGIDASDLLAQPAGAAPCSSRLVARLRTPKGVVEL
mmetsp:Transcript_34511/g.114278  ORF Transcript_34511/g.114278 Transcript_34511/m.114278 type:complete len:415 (+) Transcript_34511:50-1294(+)